MNQSALQKNDHRAASVVILNWNGRKFLEQFLPSVVASCPAGTEVVVADNASTDDSVEYVRRLFPTVRIIRNEKNHGFAGGYNKALSQVSSDYYILLNSDVHVSPGWIEPVLRLMEGDPSVAACQPKILAHGSPSHFEYAGASGGWIDSYGYPFSRGRIFEHCEIDRGQYDSAVPCFWASGAALFVRSKVYHELGGFDEHFFAHQEEIDLCWRMQSAGYKVFVQPASVVWHVGGGTLPRGNSLKTYLNFRNNLLMLYKNLPFGELFWRLPIRFALDGLAAWRALFSGDPGFFLSVLKAHLHFIPGIFSVKRSAKTASSSRLHGVYHGSIVWNYFVKKRVEFSQIVGNK